MNAITGLVIIISVAIISFTALVITDKVQINGISSSSQIKTLESQLQQANAKIDVLYGKPPQPVATNQIILPAYTADYAQNCNVRQNCVEPESIVVTVGDSVTWINKDNNEHIISHTSNYTQTHCGSTDSSINLMLAPEQSSSFKFDKAGQYDFCVQGYNGDNTHGTIIVKDKTGLKNI